MSNYEKISQRAYELWEKTGRLQGKETEHWLQAEAEIKREEMQGSPRAGSSKKETEAGRGRHVFAL
jgi:hypothetical protein